MTKKNASTDPKLKATVKQLREDLKRSEDKRASWKKRALSAETALADVQTRLRQSEKRARKAGKKAEATTPARTATTPPSRALGVDLDPATPATPAATATTAGPDASWTVARLRAEARERGLTGLSGKPKAELLKALT